MVIGIFGARRVGKTFLMKKIQEELKGKILFVQGDDLSIAEILSSQKTEQLRRLTSGYDYLFIDEAQMIPNIGQSLKLIIDNIPNLSVMVSGSSSFDLKNKIGEPLVGRSKYFHLYPISELEWGVNEDFITSKANLENRLIFGSYPQVAVSETDQEKKDKLESIKDGYLLKDKNNYKKPLIAITLVIVLILAIVLGLKNQNSNNELTITAMFPITGGLSSYGDVASKSSILAVEEINANGGINGKTLKLNLQDHKCDAKESVSIYKQFKSKTNVFSTVACSGTALAVAPMLENDGEILLGTTLSTPKITGISKNLFRNWSSDAEEAGLFAKLLKTVDYQKIGIIYEETDYAKGLKESLERNILSDSNDKKVYSEGFASGATDVRSQLIKLQSSNVDVVFISPQTVTTGEIVIKQMTELGFKPRVLLVNDNIIKSEPLLKKYSSFLDGAYGADYKVENSKAIEDFKAKYKARFGEECKQINICVAQYDAIKIIANSLIETQKDGNNSQKIQEYLKNVDYQGVSGEIRFDDKNDRENANYTLLKVEGGVAVGVK